MGNSSSDLKIIIECENPNVDMSAPQLAFLKTVELSLVNFNFLFLLLWVSFPFKTFCLPFSSPLKNDIANDIENFGNFYSAHVQLHLEIYHQQLLIHLFRFSYLNLNFFFIDLVQCLITTLSTKHTLTHITLISKQIKLQS